MDPTNIITGIILGILSYLLVYYIENFDQGFSSRQLFDRYDYSKIGYWCIIILSLLYLAQKLYFYSYAPSDMALNRIILTTLIELGAITAAIRRLRE